VNAGGTLRLLDAARRAAFPGPILVVGSSEAYGRIPAGVPCSEDAPLAPVSPYGVSKAAADHATRVYAASFGLRALVARPFSHTGPGQAPVFAVASWARQIAAFEAADPAAGAVHRLKVGNLAPVRDYGDVRDVVRAYVALLEQGEAGAAYNVATGQETTLRAIVDRSSPVRGEDRSDGGGRALRPNDVPTRSARRPASRRPRAGPRSTAGTDTVRPARCGAPGARDPGRRRSMSRIAVVGTGYVGLVTGACLADFGNTVRCIDVDAAKIARLAAGEILLRAGNRGLVARRRRPAALFQTDWSTRPAGPR
jgi:nucleoside-diphosphate-sugar epimerase